ncbi:hypothetical protein C7444_11038 [Sphaerotilus hippei]|uniref:Sigma 54 modulation/S30EA-like ribosomal protein n=1 Tax=Sphaerotilus hippei TaxID=744406 RepID=A0A318GYV3_9BURK|nr:HPF/RaiA family ribosome-associated protein [Sphaerotilus hippei]PXW95193.1 hypothetical protein C7444_11038 [Sphaerotilus hippei]
MHIEFESRDPATTLLRDTLQQRLRSALRRLAWWVPHARVRLVDDNGPRGGQDKRCQLQLSPRQGPPVVVTAVADDWRTAFERALARAAQGLRRRHARQQDRPLLTGR